MTTLKHHLERTPPPTLFHYTKQESLLAIVKGGQLWASFSRYLNDVSEFTVAKDLAVEVLKEKRLTGGDSAVLDKLAASIEIVGWNVAVFSFSEHEDLLSQWRAYCNGGTGYAIGFDSEQLELVAARNDCVLAACVYDKKKQLEIMTDLVETAYKSAIAGKPADLSMELDRWGLIFKSQGFKEEGEWRLISKRVSFSNSKVDYRAGISTIVPYVTIPLAAHKEPLPITHVVVGPNPSGMDAISAVKGLLKKFSGQNAEIVASAIPYRHW